MTKEILINIEPQEKRVAIVGEGRLEEFYIERPQDKTIVGNIYKGRIEAVLPSLGAAFVDIGLPKKGFLYLSEIEYAFEALEPQEEKLLNHPANAKTKIEKGQEVLVLKSRNGWSRIRRLDGKLAWVKSDAIEEE